MKCLYKPLQNKEVFQQERFLGWYVDGEWKVENQELSFLNYKPRSFLITNNLLIDSPLIKFNMKLDFKRASKENLQAGVPRIKDETFAISFSSLLYPIKTFDEKSTHNYMHGFTFFIITNRDNNYMFLREFPEPTKFDLKRAKSLKFQKDETRYCKINYEDKEINTLFIMDYEKGFLSAYVNDMLCISFRLKKENYDITKTGFTMQGYSGRSNPIKATLNFLQITKKVFIDKFRKNNFVDDAVSFSRSVENFNRSLTPEEQKKNLLNIMKEQGRIDKGLENTANIVDLIAVRSQAIEDMVEKIYKIKEKDQNENIFYKNKKFEESLQETTNKLEKMIDFNANVFQEFADFYKDFTEVEKLYESMNQFDKIYQHISQLDDIILINEYEGYLTDLSGIQNNKQEQQDQQNLLQQMDKELKQLGISNGFTVLSILILLSIIFMIFLIIKRAQNMNKTLF